MNQIFLDLDGVLADTVTYYRNLFQQDLTWTAADFPNMTRHGSFYLDQPLMPDAMELWHTIRVFFHPQPIILTGVPDGVPDVEKHKRMWVEKHFGISAHVITCPSRDKRKYGKRGDILIDDREKYASLWREMGGIFILHGSARQSLMALARIYRANRASGKRHLPI